MSEALTATGLKTHVVGDGKSDSEEPEGDQQLQWRAIRCRCSMSLAADEKQARRKQRMNESENGGTLPDAAPRDELPARIRRSPEKRMLTSRVVFMMTTKGSPFNRSGIAGRVGNTGAWPAAIRHSRLDTPQPVFSAAR